MSIFFYGITTFLLQNHLYKPFLHSPFYFFCLSSISCGSVYHSGLFQRSDVSFAASSRISAQATISASPFFLRLLMAGRCAQLQIIPVPISAIRNFSLIVHSSLIISKVLRGSPCLPYKPIIFSRCVSSMRRKSAIKP